MPAAAAESVCARVVQGYDTGGGCYWRRGRRRGENDGAPRAPRSEDGGWGGPVDGIFGPLDREDAAAI
jgi:hypothetical protein